MLGESSMFEHMEIIQQCGTYQETKKPVPNLPITHGLFSASAHKLKSFIPSSLKKLRMVKSSSTPPPASSPKPLAQVSATGLVSTLCPLQLSSLFLLQLSLFWSPVAPRFEEKREIFYLLADVTVKTWNPKDVGPTTTTSGWKVAFRDSLLQTPIKKCMLTLGEHQPLKFQ